MPPHTMAISSPDMLPISAASTSGVFAPSKPLSFTGTTYPFVTRHQHQLLRANVNHQIYRYLDASVRNY